MTDEVEPARCPDVDIVVVDEHLARVALGVDDWSATTLLACVSEDPADWSQVASVWPRYQTGPSADRVEDLDFTVVNIETALSQLSHERAWMVIDLRTKRVCLGRANDLMERDGCYAMDEDGVYGRELRILIHLPPWWEFHRNVDLSMVDQPRREVLCVFRPQREVLWGPELTKGLAELMLARLDQDDELSEILSSLAPNFFALAAREAEDSEEADDDGTAIRYRELRNELYKSKVAIHREWLMTPRSDLNGRMPRQCLHGGTSWISLLVEGQQWQFSSDESLTPLPAAMAQNPNVPMGLSEVVLYFDLCRDLIDAGWVHLSFRINEGAESSPEKLAAHLAEVQHRFMYMPYEGGDSPSTIIRAERHRLPRLIDAEHAGAIDCDCPICEMMKVGSFGPSFEGFDGHHLELDGEFAFSLYETQEEWDEHQRQYEELVPSIGGKREDDEEEDEFGSVWKSTYVSQAGIPGDSKGHLAIGFLLADMMGSLKQLGSQNDVDELKFAFREYRGAGQYELPVATEQFQQVLEQVAQRHSELVSRSADLQHRLDEMARRVNDIESDEDFL